MDNFVINKEDVIEGLLSREYYFQSLLQALHSNDLLSSREIESIQLQLLDIITETVGYYTRNESSSVRVETAEQIMLSICFTIGLVLKSKSSIKECIELIKKERIKVLFAEGEKILKAKVHQCKRLFDIVNETRVETDNYAYIDTIDHGILLFFKEYDFRFASHETQASIDYPLAVEENDLAGVEYMENYLNKLAFENRFCSYFDNREIKALLKNFNKSSKQMLINIFQLVLTNYLGCILVGKRERSLEITRGDRSFLENAMENLSQRELEKLIFVAKEKLCQEFSIEDKNFVKYINRTTTKITSEIKRNLENNTLEKLFITLSKQKKNSFKYVDGKSLSNSSFRSITEEIRDCDNAEEKIEIIREELHSLKDLEDVLGADCIFGDEFFDVFNALEDFEIALLVKNSSNDTAIDTEYGTESEKEWHEKLKIYLESMNDMKRGEIFRMVQEIDM